VILGNHFFTNGSRDILRINDGPTLVLENRVVLPAASNAPPFARYVSVGAPQAPVLVQNDVGAGKRARAGLSCFEPGTLPALQVLASGETRPLAPDNARCTTRAVTCSDGELACAR
jgi:hypothetical protein